MCNNTFAQVLLITYCNTGIFLQIFLKYKAQARGIEVTRKWRKVNMYVHCTYCIFIRREPLYWKLWKSYSSGHALGIWIWGWSLFYKRELWSSKSAGAHSTKSLKISGCKRWCPKDLRVRAPAAPVLTHLLYNHM